MGGRGIVSRFCKSGQAVVLLNLVGVDVKGKDVCGWRIEIEKYGRSEVYLYHKI